MKLRTRLLISLGLTTVCLFVGLSQLSEGLIMRGFANLEAADVERNLERVRQTVEQMSADLRVKNADWALWDETYQFMADRNETYRQTNVRPNAVETLQMDFLLYVGSDLKEAASASAARENLPRPDSSQLIQSIRRGLLSKDGLDQGVQGVVTHQGFPMVVSAVPIRRNGGVGEPRGWLVFASYFDGGLLSKLRKITRLDVRVLTPGQAQNVSPNSLMATHADKVVGYAHINDIDGQETMVVQLEEPRLIYQQGQSTVKLVKQMILAVGLIFGLVILFVLERFALARLGSLTHQVEAIGELTSITRIRIGGKDELSVLATRINGMLRGLAKERSHVIAQQQEIAAKNAVLESAIEGIGEIDREGRFVAANGALARMLCLSADDIKGMRWTDTICEGDLPAVESGLRLCQTEGRADLLLKGHCANGTIFYQEVTLIPAMSPDGDSSGCHIFAKDVTERKVLEMQIEHQAFHDKLTDLPNRALFMNRIEQAFAKAKRNGLGTAALFIDLDNFKLVNDSLGHDAGDALLIEVARRLRSCVRPGDTVARLGGDEFTILLEDLTSIDEAEVIAQRILEALRAPVQIGDSDAYASASIGIAFATDPDMLPEQLMKNADTTMYYAKSKGKAGYIVYEPGMLDTVTERLELETALRKGLENGEFFVQYQPLVDLKTGLVIGAEALARWRHPVKGLIPPIHFIPIAEETGLIAQLGEFVLDESCRQLRRWQIEHDRPDLTVSVNISGRQLQQTDVVDRVKSILSSNGLRPGSLTLEITESLLMERIECVGKLRALRESGVRLALDDFGTGYSSLSRLSSFPIDTIKIDRSFISRLDEEDQSRAVVEAIMALSKSMSINVTSEGVETASQMNALKDMGCDVGQGYLFAKPLDPVDFARSLVPGERAGALAA